MAKQSNKHNDYHRNDEGLWLPKYGLRGPDRKHPSSRRGMGRRKCCCEEAKPCDACDTSGGHRYPRSFEVVVSGVTNGVCGDCVSANGTFICTYNTTITLPYSGGGCRSIWMHELENQFCSNGPLTHLKVGIEYFPNHPTLGSARNIYVTFDSDNSTNLGVPGFWCTWSLNGLNLPESGDKIICDTITPGSFLFTRISSPVCRGGTCTLEAL